MNDDNEQQIAEARRRTPSLTDAQWLAWLASVEAMGGKLVLPFTGEPYAEYPRQPATHADS